MSISKFQEKFLGKGCGVAIGVGMAAVFLGLGFNQCARGSALNGQANPDQPDHVTVATIGSLQLTTSDINVIQDSISQQSQGNDSPSASIRNQAQAVQTAAARLALAYIAERDHIPVDDAAVIHARQTQLQEQIQQAEDALVATKKLKNPTPAQISAAFAEQYKKTPQQIIDDAVNAVKTQLANKDQRTQVLSQSIPLIVENALEAKATPTDQQLKSEYDTYIVKRIFLASAKNANLDTAVGQIQQALKGGMTFDAAIDKFSNDPIRPGKKLSENTTNLPVQMIDLEPEYKGLKGQKAGFVSAPIAVPGGKAIFEITGVQNSAPKDFQTNIAKYRSEFTHEQALKQLQNEVTTVLSSSSTTWSNPGYKALYDAQVAITDPTMSGNPAALQKVIEEAKAVRSSSGEGQVQATDAYYLAFDVLYNSPGANKAKLRDERIEVLTAMLESNEDFDARMELVDLYAQKKDATDAIAQLQQAAEANQIYDVNGQRRFGDIAAKRTYLVGLGLAKPADLAGVDAAQVAWKKGKADQDKQDAEAKKQQAIDKANQAKVDKENAALVEKQKEEAAKAGPKTAPNTPSSSSQSSNGSKYKLIPNGTMPGGK